MIISQYITRFLRIWDISDDFSLRWRGLCCVWDYPHKIGVRRKTRKDISLVLQVRISAKGGSITLQITACPLLIKSSLLSNEVTNCLPFLSSPESRKDFVKTVHSILREKHRRQLLKTESLPLNQQYVPFGGKRLCALKGARPTINRAGKCQSVDALTQQLQVHNLFLTDRQNPVVLSWVFHLRF